MSFFYMQLLFPRAAPNLICFTYFPRPYPTSFPSSQTVANGSFASTLPFFHSNMQTYRNEIQGANNGDIFRIKISMGPIHGTGASYVRQNLPQSILLPVSRLGKKQHAVRHSKRRISTGKILAAERDGTTVAAILIANAAAAIHSASEPFARKGTYGIA